MAPALREANATATAGAQEDSAAAAVERFTGLYQRPFGSEALVLPWQGRLAVIRLPTQNPLSSMETFDPIGDSRFRRSGARPDVAEVIEFTSDSGGLKLWRGHQFWVQMR